MSILEKVKEAFITEDRKDEAENKTDVNVVEAEMEKSESLESVEKVEETKTNSIHTELKSERVRKIVKVCKMGSDHNFANINNHDFAFNLLNMKVVTDGCGSGKHSEVGTRIFGQLFARKVKENYDNGETIDESNFISVVDGIFKQMLNLCSDNSFIFENYCFTILVCFELENEFVVYSCGDGYIIKENSNGIEFEQLDDGEYPCYYVYNFIEDKSCLVEYKDGVTFKITRFNKEEYQNVGVATDGLRFYENLDDDIEKRKLIDFLHEGKGPQIEKLINRNTIKFHDDISICF